MIHIYGKSTETTRLLAKNLGCKISRRYLPSRKCLIINWGYSCGRGLNSHLISNKMKEFEILHEAGLTPKLLYFLPDKEKDYPVLGRKCHHTHGNDILFYEKMPTLCVTHYDFYVQYISKIAEFRAHVLGNEVVLITKKIPKEGEESDPVIWNYNRGYSQCTYYKTKRYWGIITDIALKAIKVIKYDFGAVDVIIDKEGKAYILEVNSAPGLTIDNRIESYVNYFKKLEKQCQNV